MSDSRTVYMEFDKMKSEKQIWDEIFQTCARLIYAMLAAKGWNQKYLGYQEGGI